MHVTNKYLQATAESERLAQDKLVGAILLTGLLSLSKCPVVGRRLIGPKRTLIFRVSCTSLKNMAETTELEPAASAVTV